MPQKIDLKKRFWQQFQQLPKSLKKKPLFLAVSAGRDSTVLAHVVLALKEKLPPIHFIHVNYHLRTPDSDKEASFLKDWARQEGISIHLKNLYPKTKPKDLQNWARVQRYRFFSQVIAKQDKNSAKSLVLTAHHQRDQVETMLSRMLRNAGLKGFSGMQVLEELQTLPGAKLAQPIHIFRPFLKVPFELIVEYAEKYQLPFHQDASNEALDYLRNRLRHRVLPLLEAENPKFQQALIELGAQSREAQEALQALAIGWLKKNLQIENQQLEIPMSPLLRKPKALRQQIVLSFLQQGSPNIKALASTLKAVEDFFGSSQSLQDIPLSGAYWLKLSRAQNHLCLRKSRRVFRRKVSKNTEKNHRNL